MALATRRAERVSQDARHLARDRAGSSSNNAFVLEQVFRRVMQQADCRMLTINSCMGTIMPMSETTACLPLSTLNDDGYLAFCESDFVVIPSGMLLASIAGRPMFLNDPTYPHDGVITLAHCTAPRKMDGKTSSSRRASSRTSSPTTARRRRSRCATARWSRTSPPTSSRSGGWASWARSSAHPFLPICRSQIDIRFTCDSLKLAERMPGFHWMTVYGDYMRETGYALRKVGIQWEVLG